MKSVAYFVCGALIATGVCIIVVVAIAGFEHKQKTFDDLVRSGCRETTAIHDGHPDCCRRTCVMPGGQIYTADK